MHVFARCTPGRRIQRLVLLRPPRYASYRSPTLPSFSPCSVKFYRAFCASKSIQDEQGSDSGVDEADRWIGVGASYASLAEQIAYLRRKVQDVQDDLQERLHILQDGLHVLFPTRLPSVSGAVTQTFVASIRMLQVDEGTELVAAWPMEPVATRSCLLELYWRVKATQEKGQTVAVIEASTIVSGLQETLRVAQSGTWSKDGVLLGLVSTDRLQDAVKGLPKRAQGPPLEGGWAAGLGGVGAGVEGTVWLNEKAQCGFEMLVVGCGGGPLETNMSSYLLKPFNARWEDGCVSLEGGSGLGALSNLIESIPHSFTDFSLQEFGINYASNNGLGPSSSSATSSSPSSPTTASDKADQSPTTTFSATVHRPSIEDADPCDSSKPARQGHARSESGSSSLGHKRSPSGGGGTWNGPGSVGREGGGRAAGRVWEYIRCFTVSHAHLDHCQGLVISSGAALNARPLYGTFRTLANMDRMFDGGVWPRLVGWESDGVKTGRAYLYREVEAPTEEELPLAAGMTFHAYPLSHGLDPSFFNPKHKLKPKVNGEGHGAPPECYDSTAFFVKENSSGEAREMLFFGDVEPDSMSKRPLNLPVWRAAAPKIVAGKLTTIFLECSYPSSQPAAQLWGHLSPPFVLEEMEALAELVIEERRRLGWEASRAAETPLMGVIVVIIHIKDDILSLPKPTAPVAASPTNNGPSLTVAPATPAMPVPASPQPSSSRVVSPSMTASPSLSVHSVSPSLAAVAPVNVLSMSPPFPSPPVRRASGGGMPNIGWGFSRRASLAGLPGTPDFGRRMSMPMGGSFSPLSGFRSPLMNSLTSPGLGVGFASFAMGGTGLAKTKPPTELAPMKELSESGSPVVGGDISPRTPEMATMGSEGKTEDDDEEEEEETEEETVHERIERELNELEEERRTGVRFLLAEQGMRIAF
ncbi:cAMP-specific phosphodiesterase [Pseudohyphozyma bogoriensis]|nr:cAMP-specific phosphodiesterase [Pseudohyphozyma bogoriensis]